MLSRMIRTLKLDSSVYEEVEHDKTATGQAMAVVVICSLVGSLGHVMGAGGLKSAIFAAISSLIGWVLMSVVSLGMGKLMGGKGDVGEVMRALGFAYTPQLLGLIPFIGWLFAFILGLIAWVQALRQSLDLTTGKAIVVAVLSVVAFIIVMVPIAMMFGIGAAVAGA